jgi:class 3 adenylate cyclase
VATTATSKTFYAKAGDLHIAYRVIGDGPMDLIYVPTWVSHVELIDEHPLIARFFEEVGRFARVIVFDRRGAGLSDPISDVPPLEEQIDDVLAVMDAAGAERAALFAQLEGGAMASLFAATHPERVSGLILFSAWARMTWAPDYTWANKQEERAPIVDEMIKTWGDGSWVAAMAPSRADDSSFLEWFGKLQRYGASPGVAKRLMLLAGSHDVRAVLPTIQVPTLVMRRRGDQFLNREHALYLAEHIPGAELRELPGTDALAIGSDAGDVVAEVEEFLTGARHERAPDRVLATVLFTDICGSTERAAELGDRRWRELLQRHDEVVRSHVERHRGRAVKSTGDGVLATFDGPARAIQASQAIVDSVRQLGIEIRAGLHTGECEVIGDDVGGLAVHIGARVMSEAGAGEVMVSSTVKDLVVGAGIEFADRGEHDLKGVPGAWRLFAVES